MTLTAVLRPGGALPAYFTGLLPEGHRLGALHRAVQTSLDDELSLLLAVGTDAIGGVQGKVSAAMINVPAVRAGRSYLLKLDPPEFRGLVENEALFLRACARSGLLVAQFDLEPGESIHVTPGTRHRVPALVDTVMLEASTTEVNDVVRLEDRYGRQGTNAPNVLAVLGRRRLSGNSCGC